MPPVPQDQQFMNQFGRPDGPHQFFFGPGGGLMMMVLFAAVIALGVLAITSIRRQRHLHHGFAPSPMARGSEALRVLDERFARGEIDPEDYKVRRDLLSGAGQPVPTSA